MSIDIRYTSQFVRAYSRLDVDLKAEVKEKIGLFKEPSNHEMLKVHKLHGRLKDSHSFSVNYKYRIVFRYIGKDSVAIISVGNHEVYK